MLSAGLVFTVPDGISAECSLQTVAVSSSAKTTEANDTFLSTLKQKV